MRQNSAENWRFRGLANGPLSVVEWQNAVFQGLQRDFELQRCAQPTYSMRVERTASVQRLGNQRGAKANGKGKGSG
jgi:hypothetical protein